MTYESLLDQLFDINSCHLLQTIFKKLSQSLNLKFLDQGFDSPIISMLLIPHHSGMCHCHEGWEWDSWVHDPTLWLQFGRTWSCITSLKTRTVDKRDQLIMFQKTRNWLRHNTCHIANSATCTLINKPYHDELLKTSGEWWQHTVSPPLQIYRFVSYELAVTNTFNNGVFYVSFA